MGVLLLQIVKQVVNFKMKIKELGVNQGNVEVEGTIKELEEIREINKYGRTLRLRNAVLEDDSGTIKLTLWN